MANFLLLYTGGNPPTSAAEGAAVTKLWVDWFTQIGPAVVDPGNPTNSGAKTISPDGRVSEAGPAAPVTGYSILRAESLDEATRFAQSCPHLAANGSVTLYEIYPAM